MSTELENQIRETLSNLDDLSPDKIHGLIEEALKTFTTLNQKSQSTDPKERDEAYKIAMSLKSAIEAQTEDLVKEAGIDPKTFSDLSKNEAVFNPDTWQELSSAREELESLRSQLGVKKKPSSPASKKNKHNRITV